MLGWMRAQSDDLTLTRFRTQKFAAAWAERQAMTTTQAVAYGLEEPAL